MTGVTFVITLRDWFFVAVLLICLLIIAGTFACIGVYALYLKIREWFERRAKGK